MLQHINPWNTAIILWQAICVLWIVPAIVEHSLPQAPDHRRDRYSYLYAIAMSPAAILTFWPATAIPPLNSPLYQSNTIGLILMIVGAIGLVVSALFWNSWGGFGGRSYGRRSVYRDGAGNTVVEERHEVV